MTIYEMRTALGDTQSEFAERYNIPFRTIQNWEAGVRKPPEYVVALLESRVQSDLYNRKTRILPKYNAHKKELPKRRDYIGAISWLKAVRECLGDSFVFALDEALMCQGNFGGRSDEYIVTVMIPPPTLTELCCSEITSAPMISGKSEGFVLLILTERSQMRLQMKRFWICKVLQRPSADTTSPTGTASREYLCPPNIGKDL